MQIQGRQCLVTSDYHSNFIEVDFLADTSSATVVTKLKEKGEMEGEGDEGKKIRNKENKERKSKGGNCTPHCPSVLLADRYSR